MIKSNNLKSRYGFYAVGSASPNVAVGNPAKNVDFILEELSSPELKACNVVVLPELSLTGYTCGDLFLQSALILEAYKALFSLVDSLKEDPRLIAVGLPVVFKGRLLNCAALFRYGSVLGLVPKSHIPNYQEFYERRWFSSGTGIINESVKILDKDLPIGTNLLFNLDGVKVGVEICEDLWVPVPPSSLLCKAGAEIILNLSATDDNIGKFSYIKDLVSAQSARCRCVYAYSSAGRGESSTDLVFSGINLIAYDGSIKAESRRFSRVSSSAIAVVDIEKLRNDRRKYSTFFDESFSSEPIVLINCPSGNVEVYKMGVKLDKISVNPHPFVPSDNRQRNESCEEIVNIQSWGLAQRLISTGCKHLVVGVSGGLDSTLAILVAHFTFRRLELDVKGIVGVTMPADATSTRTFSNAKQLMKDLCVTSLEIPVRKAVELHFQDIGHDPSVHNAVYENSQARERTQILMDLANKFNGMVLGTGDMSELALGWCTYNGDHMSMYNVNAGVPKTLVRHLVNWFADTTSDEALRKVLLDIVDTPISPELIPSSGDEEIGQKTEELIGPYELHDFFLFHVLRNGFEPKKIFLLSTIAFSDKFSPSVIKKWLVNFYKRFFAQQFKRSCMPDGPKIGSVCLSPRGDWRMPSDASAHLWISQAQDIDIDNLYD